MDTVEVVLGSPPVAQGAQGGPGSSADKDARRHDAEKNSINLSYMYMYSSEEVLAVQSQSTNSIRKRRLPRMRCVIGGIALAVVVLAAAVAASVVVTSGDNSEKNEVLRTAPAPAPAPESADADAAVNSMGITEKEEDQDGDVEKVSKEKEEEPTDDPRMHDDDETSTPNIAADENATASTLSSCTDDPNWFTITKQGQNRSCAFIATKDAWDRSSLCKRLGHDDERRGTEACPNACLSCHDATSSSTITGGLTFSVEQITPPNSTHHYMFGYIGQSLTIPWDINDRYILALQFDSHERLPTAEDVATVVRIDTATRDEEGNYIITSLDVTRAWNTQQGTMFYWNPEAPATQFFFNDRDVESGKIFTALFDMDKMERIREYRYDDTPIANAGVCPQGGFFYALNYGRMARLRPVTGYGRAYDWTEKDAYPTSDGLWKVDIGTGEKELLVPFAEIASMMTLENAVDDNTILNGSHLYINHALSNRQCSKIYFFGRGAYLGAANPLVTKPEMAIDQPFIANSDGSGIKRVAHIGGHPEWSEEDSIVFGRAMNIPSLKNQIVLYNVDTDLIVGTVGDGTYFQKTSGDLTLSTNGEMFANGWEEGGNLVYAAVNTTDGSNGLAPLVPRGRIYTSGNLRIDAAPRWSRRGNKLLVPGWSSSNDKRCLNVISVANVDA